MKRAFICICLLALLASGCARPAEGDDGLLTLERVRELARRGESLTWQDFSLYEGEDIGSGLYIYRYPVGEEYALLIGGGSLSVEPMYIRLVALETEESIDIRTEDIDAFLKDG